ncbi:MAG: PP2C family protein-serine/threonine phosphatase [Sphingobacteriales bacterium]|nr:PP2C family protein-serine/threonine phosphatase [Sphingobacteriales bacterium]
MATIAPPDTAWMLLLLKLRIDTLLDVTKAINQNNSTAELFKIYEFVLRAQMSVASMAIFYFDGQWKFTGGYGFDNNNNDSTDVAETIPFSDYLLQFTHITPLDPPTKPACYASFEVAVPVYHKDKPLAFVLLGKFASHVKESLYTEHYDFIQAVTNIIIVAIENKRLFKQRIEQERLLKELEVAGQVQNLIIPKQLPSNKRVDMQGIYQPHHNIGGDFYDYIPLNNHEFMVCMADISGKGIGAAMLMAHAQAIVRTLALENPDLKVLIRKLNKRLLETTNGDHFITFFIANCNLKQRTLTYVNAGHNPQILAQDNKITWLNNGCTLLGAFSNLKEIVVTTEQLKPNALILTYTDGITDLENEAGQRFETERLLAFTTQNAHQKADDFNLQLLQTLKQYKGRQNFTDDVSVLTFRVH